MHTLVLLYIKDAFKAGVTQNHVILFFIVLYHQIVNLNGGCSREDGCQTAGEPLQDRVRFVKFVSSILVGVAAIIDTNGALQFMLAIVHVPQGLVLGPDILNLLEY